MSALSVQDPAAIVRAARAWIGTAFRHYGRCQKTLRHAGGCDCIGLVLGVAHTCGLVSRHTKRPLQTHDHRVYALRARDRSLYAVLDRHLHAVKEEQQEPGDIVLFQWQGLPQHVAILGDGPHDGDLTLIHAFLAYRAVVEHRYDSHWRDRSMGVFRFDSVLASKE